MSDELHQTMQLVTYDSDRRSNSRFHKRKQVGPKHVGTIWASHIMGLEILWAFLGAARGEGSSICTAEFQKIHRDTPTAGKDQTHGGRARHLHT